MYTGTAYYVWSWYQITLPWQKTQILNFLPLAWQGHPCYKSSHIYQVKIKVSFGIEQNDFLHSSMQSSWIAMWLSSRHCFLWTTAQMWPISEDYQKTLFKITHSPSNYTTSLLIFFSIALIITILIGSTFCLFLNVCLLVLECQVLYMKTETPCLVHILCVVPTTVPDI